MHIGEEMGCTHTDIHNIYIYTYTDYIAFALVYTDPGVRLKIGYPRLQWMIIIFPTKIAAFGINPLFFDGFPIDKSLTRGKGTRFTCLMQSFSQDLFMYYRSLMGGYFLSC